MGKQTIMTNIKKVFSTIQQSSHLRFILIGLVLAILFLAPYTSFIPGGRATNDQLAIMTTYAIAALGINLLLGYSGLISLASAGFMGVGALGITVLMTDVPLPFTDERGLPFIVAFVLILAIAGAMGAIVGIISLRVQGIYLAITTLFVAQILHTVFTSLRALFGAATGIRLGALHLFGGTITLDRNTPYSQGNDRYLLYMILLFALIVTMMIIYNIVKSRTGRAFMAMSRSYNAAQAMGVNVVKYRVMSFVIATMFAALSGVMYAIWNQSVPNNRWDLMISLTVVAVVVVGGLKSITGTVLGAFMIYAFPRIFLGFLADYNIVGGLLIIFVILFYPNGLMYIFTDIKKLIAKFKARLNKKRVNTDE